MSGLPRPTVGREAEPPMKTVGLPAQCYPPSSPRLGSREGGSNGPSCPEGLPKAMTWATSLLLLPRAVSWLSSDLKSRFLILNEIFFFPGNYFLLIRRQDCQSLGPGLTPFLNSQGWGGY